MNLFYFDIETASKYKSLDHLKGEDKVGYDLFKIRYESLKKFDDSVSDDPEIAYFDKAPLIPEFARIVCMSFGVFKDGKKSIFTIIENDEKTILEKMSKVFVRAHETQKTLCGFNIKAFHIPFIVKKFFKYQMIVPTILNFNNLKPWEIKVIDLAESWKGSGRTLASLNEVCYELNIDIKNNITGKDINNIFWNSENKTSIVTHCENDIDSIISILDRMNKCLTKI